MFSSCGTKGGNLKNVTDTLAYTMGMELGEYVKNMDSVMEMKFDLATVVAAMKDVAKGDTSVMTRQQAMDFIQEYYMVRKPRIDSAANADFLAQVEKDNKNVKKTESGSAVRDRTRGRGCEARFGRQCIRGLQVVRPQGQCHRRIVPPKATRPS